MQGKLHNIRFFRKECIAIFFLCLVAVAGTPLKVTAQQPLPDSITSLWQTYTQTENDSLKVICLARLAWFYNDYLEDRAKADSLAEAGIKLAEMTLRPALLILACNLYLESTDNDVFFDKAVSYANKALQTCRITSNLPLRWRTSKNLAGVYLSRYQAGRALSCCNEALAIATALNNEDFMAESYLYLGKCYEFNNQKTDGFRNYLIAREMTEKSGNRILLKRCYAELSRFYYENNMYDDAMEYKRKEGEIILSIRPVDSTALMWVQLFLQFIDVCQQNIRLNEQSVINIIEFARRTRNERLKTWEFALYRKHLLESDDIAVLYKFYNTTYPRDLKMLSSTDPEMYNRILAYFREYENKKDSAEYYFKKAEQLLLASPDKSNIYLSNFYNRFGQFYIRAGRNQDAIKKFLASYRLCSEDAYFGKFEYMLIASRHLETLYKNTGDYKNAWLYASMSREISDSINLISKTEQVMAEAVKRERTQMEEAAEQDRQKIRQGRNQRNMMAGFVGVFIIVSLLVFRNYRIQKKLNRLLDEEKRKSDNLLLNILPMETAEELKLTGKASARRFEEVTVMFTDFRNFTQASEQMTAEDLVHVINFYFTEFDNIISRHNIEKIKIIGDSYMCAGGLPVVNDTHAYDVVMAAIEIQEFINREKIKRSASGEPFFELRIGIHTGPVVAGIVGHKKFAYDIWGDTVNTASRLENAGEPDTINISGATYERVKDHFTCTYRGKVQAKHKGQIDMYFVEAVNR